MVSRRDGAEEEAEENAEELAGIGIDTS